MKPKTLALLGWIVACLFLAGPLGAAEVRPPVLLERQFANPPDAARPWVYWFWINGNITRQGITADLEAMKRVGIGGVLIMAVDEGTPKGPVAFASPAWRDLFQFVCQEAHRLGLQVNMTNDAGWCGSGGPWITPALSMQKLVWTQTQLQGPRHVDQTLTQPEKVAGYYEDIKVLAFPTPAGQYRIPDIAGQSALDYKVFPAAPSAYPTLPATQCVPAGRIMDLTANFKDGRLQWDVPAGNWTILRLGHTSTGTENHPAPKSGLGLECDKLNPRAADAMFAGLMGKLVADNQSQAGNTLAATHIDSWEVHSQNWTPRMLAEFRQRRGYDALPYLPVITGRVVDNLEKSQRFLWDWRQTISELLAENYAGRFESLARQHGLRLTIEAYGDGPFDDIRYGGRADEPMGEFWSWGFSFGQTVTEMTSAAHVYGKRIVGAESYTAIDYEAWQGYPGTFLKTLADWAFCEGVNRLVVHRYTMQPWLNYQPGMSMGGSGVHYERTETWWEQSQPWHQYLARCQYLLRQGWFVADICYLQPEGAPRPFIPPIPRIGRNPLRPGYNFDGCSSEVVLTRMSVANGRIVLPDGMSYRLLVLPDVKTMTPQLLSRIKQLVQGGATVVGPRPEKSPSLENYPACDNQIQQLAGELWGDCDGKKVTAHSLGKGRIVWGIAPEKVLAGMGVPMDFAVGGNLRDKLDFTHRHLDDGTEIYFLANRKDYPVQGVCRFRVVGLRPELFHPQTGLIEPAPSYWESRGQTTLPIHLDAAESVFVVFRAGGAHFDPIVSIQHDSQTILPESTAPLDRSPIFIRSAWYGAPGYQSRIRDVTASVRALVRRGQTRFAVASMAAGGDPAPRTVKILTVDYLCNGKAYRATGYDSERIDLRDQIPPLYLPKTTYVSVSNHDDIVLEAWQDGQYQLRTAAGKTLRVTVTGIASDADLGGPWDLRFPAHSGAPAQVTLDKLIPWNQCQDAGVRYFSGTATYRKTFHLSPRQLTPDHALYLDLGQVEVMARVKLNGKDLGILWKPPYRVEITSAAKPGDNELQIEVTNLWINRMIGDENLPEDSPRTPSGELRAWPRWVEEGKPSPTGRFTFTTWRLWKKGSPLHESGLIGPVALQWSRKITLH